MFKSMLHEEANLNYGRNFVKKPFYSPCEIKIQSRREA